MKPRSFIKQVNVCTLNLHKKDQFRLELILIEAWRRPTLTGGNPPTTIGAEELNFRVRYGNGCDLFAIATKPDGENVLSKLDNNVHASH